MESSRSHIRELRLHQLIGDIKKENKKLREEKEKLKKRLVEMLQEEKAKLTESIANYEKDHQRKTR